MRVHWISLRATTAIAALTGITTVKLAPCMSGPERFPSSLDTMTSQGNNDA
jgi:hypothetical protein